MPWQPSSLKIDPFAKLGELVREELLGTSRGKATPERLKAILNTICSSQPQHGAVDPHIVSLFDNVVYVVLNHPPLRSQGLERHFVAALNLRNFGTPVEQHLSELSGSTMSPIQDSGCELVFFGDISKSHLIPAASWLWHRKWQDYWNLTIEGEQSRGWYTWNQLLLKGVSPVPMGVCWDQDHRRGAEMHESNPQTPYLHLSSALANRIGLPDPASDQWGKLLLRDKASGHWNAGREYIDNDLIELRDLFNSIYPKGHSKTTAPVAWAVEQLARYYGFWGGKAFLSIPVVIGALGFYRVAVLSICSVAPLELLQYREWKLIAGAMVRPLIEEEMARLVKSREMAKITYSIGHSLKSRFRGMSSKLAVLREKVSKKLAKDKAAQAMASIAAEHSESCQRTAEMMNLMAALLHAEDGSDLGDEFFSREPYQIGPYLEKQCSACNAAQKRTVVEFDKADFRKILRSDLRIMPSRRRNWPGRLFDPFYDEVFFEILLNSAQHSFNKSSSKCILKLGVYDVPFPQGSSHLCTALVFTNFCCDPDCLQTKGFIPEVWLDCRHGHEGGLRFMADCVDLTLSGRLEARFLKRGSGHVFQTRLTLEDLQKDHEC
jgi:hypothetical protein